MVIRRQEKTAMINNVINTYKHLSAYIIKTTIHAVGDPVPGLEYAQKWQYHG
jgi:hypothetical protein